MPLLRCAALPPAIRIALPLIVAAMLSACGGSGGEDAGQPPANVTVSGKITFDRIPFKTTGAGLNPGAPVESPARQVLVEALDDTNAIVAMTTTDAAGDYTLQVPSNRSVKIRAKAQMQKTGTAPTWDFKVLNNANGDALYVLEGSASSTGTTNDTRNLRATSGWSGTSYTGTRAAAPFAILDTVYRAKELIVTAAATAAFPALNLYWSSANKPTEGVFCTSSGDIGTTFYTGGAASAGNCTQGGALLPGIYILGDFTQGDTDEFDQHVIAHEFGHYVEDKFSRADSIGGGHGTLDRVDLRVAFGEGWGNAYSAMVLADPAYRDSFAGISRESGFNLETDSLAVEGWFSELSVGEILWDLFDNVADAGDQVSLGFPPIFSVLTGAQKNTDALTSIFSFADALRTANPGQGAGINALLAGESISNSDAFGSSETNAGGSSTALPIYQDAVLQQIVCSSGGDDSRNKLGYRRFLRLNLTSATAVSITATGAVDPANPGSVAATDPDIFIHRRGVIIAFSDARGPTETVAQQPLAAGLHIVEVYDFDVGAAPRCMSVSIAGI